MAVFADRARRLGVGRLNELDLVFNGSGYGRVITEAEPTAEGGYHFRVEAADMINLAQIAADVLGLEQPHLPRYGTRNLAKWLIRYGCEVWGQPKFLQATARALIWQPKVD